MVFAEHFGHTYAMALTGDIWHVCFYELFRWEFESSKIQFEMARLPPIGCHFISASKRGWRFCRCHIGLQFTTVHCSQSGFISLQSLLQKSTQGKHHYPHDIIWKLKLFLWKTSWFTNQKLQVRLLCLVISWFLLSYLLTEPYYIDCNQCFLTKLHHLHLSLFSL